MRYIDIADRLIEQQIHDELRDKHRPRLTLRHLNALRKIRAKKARERAVHLAQIKRIYNKTDEELDEYRQQ